jgi:phosphoenolpyruvate carboxykinase (GTP)
LEPLFRALIDKTYPKDLYDRQFSLYADNILARIELQTKAYAGEENIPRRLFEVLEEQRKGLLALKATFGSVITPEQLSAA